MTQATSSVKTIDRLVRILDCFSTDRPAWSLAELSAQLDLPKSTLHRFLVGLDAHGILRRDSGDKHWRLGYRLVTWGELASKVTGFADLALPLMQEITAATGEMVALTVYSAQDVICIGKIDTRHSVRLTLEVGSRRPAHAGASSKILMAYLPKDEIEAIIKERGLARVGDNTITDPEKLVIELSTIRSQGYAQSIEETDPGAWGVATPVFDRDGSVLAAIGIGGPIQRYSDEMVQRYVALCRDACQKVSRLLGATGQLPPR